MATDRSVMLDPWLIPVTAAMDNKRRPWEQAGKPRCGTRKLRMTSHQGSRSFTVLDGIGIQLLSDTHAFRGRNPEIDEAKLDSSLLYVLYFGATLLLNSTIPALACPTSISERSTSFQVEFLLLEKISKMSRQKVWIKTKDLKCCRGGIINKSLPPWCPDMSCRFSTIRLCRGLAEGIEHMEWPEPDQCFQPWAKHCDLHGIPSFF